MGKTNWTAILLVFGVLVIAGLIYAGFSGMLGKGVVQSGVPATGSSGNTQPTGYVAPGCSQNPSFAGSAVDFFGTTVLSGTSYYKKNTDKPITSLSGVTLAPGDKMQYWLSNGSVYCKPSDPVTLQCSAVNPQVQCYLNGTVTLVAYTVPGNSLITSGGGATNITQGANDAKSVNIYYTGTSKQSAMPFGGCLAVEVPSGVTSVDASGAGLTPGCPYTWTYSTKTAGDSYFKFTVPAGFDAERVVSDKVIKLTFSTGGSNPAGFVNMTFAPANYYVSNDGNFELGIEKDKNADTTTTGLSANYYSFYMQ